MMLRISILALAATLAVAPALAETTSQPGTSSQSSRQSGPSQSLLLDDGTNAYAQDRDDNGNGLGGPLVAAAMFGITIALVAALSHRKSVSP